MPDHPVPWVLTSRTLDGGAIIRLTPSGELDLATVDRLDRAVRNAQQRATNVTLDLGHLSFMDCSSLALLTGATHRARSNGDHLTILRSSAPVIDRLFALTGIERLLEA
jgi:anti-anti-sigma factor